MEVATQIKVPKPWGLGTFELWVIHGDRGVVGGHHTLSREDRAPPVVSALLCLAGLALKSQPFLAFMRRLRKRIPVLLNLF